MELVPLSVGVTELVSEAVREEVGEDVIDFELESELLGVIEALAPKEVDEVGVEVPEALCEAVSLKV